MCVPGSTFEAENAAALPDLSVYWRCGEFLGIVSSFTLQL